MHLILGSVELHQVYVGTCFEPVWVLLDDVPSFYDTSCITQLGVISKPADGTLDPTDCVSDKDAKEHQSQDRLLGEASSSDRSPRGYRATDHNPLAANI